MHSTPTTDQLRFAVASGRFGDVEKLLDRYATEVEAEWKSASAEERQKLAQEVLTLLRWAQRTMLASRSHAQLRRMESARTMAYTPGYSRSAVSIDG